MPYVVISLRHGKKNENVGSYVTHEKRQANEGRSENFARERCPREKGKEEMKTLEEIKADLFVIYKGDRQDQVTHIAGALITVMNELQRLNRIVRDAGHAEEDL